MNLIFDHNICRRSDDDVFLESWSDYSPEDDYEDSFMETPIDYMEVSEYHHNIVHHIISYPPQVFPDTYHGSPNVTITPEGRRYYPEKRHNNLEIPDPSLLESSWASETRPSLSGPPGGESTVIYTQSHV